MDPTPEDRNWGGGSVVRAEKRGIGSLKGDDVAERVIWVQSHGLRLTIPRGDVIKSALNRLSNAHAG
jgi:hypothetical protein